MITSVAFNQKSINHKNHQNNLSFGGKGAATQNTKDVLMRGVHNVFEKAGSNSALFNAGLALIIGDFLRPPALMAVPGAKKDDKKYAVAKSMVGSTLRFILAMILFSPMEKGLKKVAKAASKNGFPYELGSKKFNSFNYFSNRGIEFIIAPFQAILFAKLLPVIVNKVFSNNKIPRTNTANFVQAKAIDKTLYSNFLGGDQK